MVDQEAAVIAKELVRLPLQTAELGDKISIKATVAADRNRGPDLSGTDCELTERIVLETHVSRRVRYFRST
ncbi:hypothetical protein ACFSOZ_17520 [Mesorhizobium newzealandense]|uniref:Uncharacterized protein n=2 Tax=Mesorhizobium TaxID=68287 RepID=A0ABW4W9C4_9HYPH